MENTLKKIIALSAALTGALLSACVEQMPPPRPVYAAPPPPDYVPAPVVYEAPPPQPVVSVYIDPPIDQPPPVEISWAPPPMLVETPPPAPFAGAFWVGGYWAWEGNWVWAHGRWAPPPHPGYTWCNPYYEHRHGAVVFVNGFWAAPGVSFVAPGLSVHIAIGVPGPGVMPGPAPIGPMGVFVPAPPGSHLGLIVPAPIGTAPAVVTGAPPIVSAGMHITVNNTTVNNVNNVTNVTHVTVVAPAGSTATGQAFNNSVPAQPHLAAAMTPVVKATAPEPASAKPIPAFVPGHAPTALPPAQTVHAEVPPALAHPQPHPGQPPQQPRPQPMPAQQQQPLQPQQPQPPQHPVQQSQPMQPAPAPHPQPGQAPHPQPGQAPQPQENPRPAVNQQSPVQQERHDVERPQPQQQQQQEQVPRQTVRPIPAKPAEQPPQPAQPPRPAQPPQQQAKPQKPNETQEKKPDEHKPSGEKKDEKKDKRDE